MYMTNTEWENYEETKKQEDDGHLFILDGHGKYKGLPQPVALYDEPDRELSERAGIVNYGSKYEVIHNQESVFVGSYTDCASYAHKHHMLTPLPGDLIISIDGKKGLLDGHPGLGKDHFLCVFGAYSGGAYRSKETGHVSCCGGPCPFVHFSDLKPHNDGEISLVPFWDFHDGFVGAGRGRPYAMLRPVWEWNKDIYGEEK